MKDNDIKIVGLSNASKPKGKTNWKIVGAIVGIVVLAFGVIAGIILVRQQQDIREKAGVTYGRCDEAGAEACPGTDGILRNCHPPESDNTPALSSCDTAGRIEFCGTRNYCCPVAGGTWTADMSACAVATATPTSSTRPDYCVSASADKAVLNSNDTLTVSSVSNTPVNGFGYAVYNLDNLYGPENPKPVCVGAGNVTSDCPNGGTHFILSDPDTNTLRTNGSTQITFGRLFITDKNTGQQLKNVSFMAYFSLNGGQVSWPQNACKAFTRMGTISTATSTSTATATSTSTTHATATATATSTSTTHATATATSTTSSGNNTSTPTATSTSTSGLAGSTATTVPLPVTGAKWPTMLGAGFGIMMILVSLALAL